MLFSVVPKSYHKLWKGHIKDNWKTTEGSKNTLKYTADSVDYSSINFGFQLVSNKDLKQ